MTNQLWSERLAIGAAPEQTAKDAVWHVLGNSAWLIATEGGTRVASSATHRDAGVDVRPPCADRPPGDAGRVVASRMGAAGVAAGMRAGDALVLAREMARREGR